MISRIRLDRSHGFTLIELLVASTILGIVIALSISSLREVSADMIKTRNESFAILQNLAFLDNLSRDVRTSRGITAANVEYLLLDPNAGADTIGWHFSPDAARRICNERTTIFPIRVKSLVVAPRETSKPIRYLILRGDFEGLGVLERGVAVRVEPEAEADE